MQHDAVPSEVARGPFDLAEFSRSVVLGGILGAADDKGVMKERVMLARECGFLSDTETRQWIADYGLDAA